ncbi:MAG: response regulator [Pseudomonadota bacterium]
MAQQFSSFNCLADAVIAVAADHTARYVNDAFCAVFGGGAETWLGKKCPLDENLKGGRTITHHGEKNIAIDWALSDGPDGSRIYVGRRIVDENDLEEETDEEAPEPETQMKLFASMSHEMRTPLNGILGMSGLLMDTELEPSQRTYVDAIHESGSSMLTLINDVLDYSKFAADQMEIVEESIDLRAIVQSVTELLSPRAAQKNIEIASYVDPRTPHRLLGDELRIKQVLYNLAGNAVKFTQHGGLIIEVHVHGRAPGGACSLRLDVRDTGVGLSEEDRERIFEEFTQAESGRAQKFEGTGLGLAIVKKIIAAMKGQIRVESTLGAGSVFSLFLSLKTDLINCDPPIQLNDRNGAYVVASRSTIVNRYLNLQLKAAGATNIITTKSTAQTIAALNDHAEPILLCDPDIAVEGGLRITKKAHTSYVMLTAATRGRIDSFRRIGFSRFLIKPIRAASLINLLNETAAIAPKRPQAPAPAVTRPRENRGGGLEILIAEDNKINALLSRTLIERAGHKVTVAENGKDVLALLTEQSFDLIFMDMHMPGMNGVETCSKIRKMSKPISTTPIIALTASDSDIDRETCRDAGMDDFITKPFDRDDLETILSKWSKVRGPAQMAS